jgi:hypothetical protein
MPAEINCPKCGSAKTIAVPDFQAFLCYACRIVRTLAFQMAARFPDFRELLMTLTILIGLNRTNSVELFSSLLTTLLPFHL